MSDSSVALLGLLLALAGSRSSGSSRSSGTTGTTGRRSQLGAARGHDPVAYARSKLATLRARYARPAVRDTLARWGPHFFQGTPPTMLCGFSASSTGPRELGGPPDYVRGELGIERAWRDAHAGDATTRADLHRAVAAVDGPEWFDDTEGQWYLGLRRYSAALDSAAGVMRGTALAIPTAAEARANLRSYGLGPWAAELAVTTYSSGAGILPTAAARAAAELAAAGGDPMHALGRAVAAEPGATFHGVQISGRWKLAHAVLRCYQRVESGRALAEVAERADLPWYPDPLGEALVSALARRV